MIIHRSSDSPTLLVSVTCTEAALAILTALVSLGLLQSDLCPSHRCGTTLASGNPGLPSRVPKSPAVHPVLRRGLTPVGSRYPGGKLRRWPAPDCSAHSSRAPCISATGVCARANRIHSLKPQEALLSYSPLITNPGFAPSLSGTVMNGMYKFQPVSFRPGMQALATSPPRAALQPFSLGLESQLLLFWSVRHLRD